MKQRQGDINLKARSSAVITANGSGAITLTGNTPDISAVAFTTDGTNGSVTLTLRKNSAVYAVAYSVSLAAAAGVLYVATQTATSLVFVCTDVATPSAINLATTATTIRLELGASL